MNLEPGLAINANVELTRPLGRGGMGSVWVAHHKTLRTDVAVKFVDASLASSDPTMLTRFEREASTAAQIKSPHVVQMLDHGITDGWPYIVMELLEGESLEDRLRRAGRMKIEEVDTVLQQCAKALGRAHSLGIIHRDLKPANLFLIDSGYDIFVKVLDFGIAKQTGLTDLESVTVSMAVVGTPKYMSLEQLVDTKSVTHSTDLWALAVIAYRALTGTVPFDADTLPGLTMKVLDGAFTPVTGHDPALPAALDAWFARAFQKQAVDRFGSAHELALTFRAAMSDVAPTPKASTSAPLVASPAALVAPGATVAMERPPFGPPPSGTTVSAVVSQPRVEPRSSRAFGAIVAAVIGVGTLATGGAVLWWSNRDATSEARSAPSSSTSSLGAILPTPSRATRIEDASIPDDASAPDGTSMPEDASGPEDASVPGATPRSNATAPMPTPRWIPQPKPAPAAPTPKPANCSGANAFYRDQRGRLVPRPDCL